MKKLLPSGVAALAALQLIAIPSDACRAAGNAKWVRPEIGTAYNGHTFVAATYPFGLLQPGPDTGREGWQYCSGYRWDDARITGFSQTHRHVFSAMGFYPFSPCGGEYVLGAPQIASVKLKVENGKCREGNGEFHVIARNLSKENKYVKSVTLNGKPAASSRSSRAHTWAIISATTTRATASATRLARRASSLATSSAVSASPS